MNNESTTMNQNERVRENLIYKKEKKDLKKIIYDIYESDGLIKKIRSKENISQKLLKIIIDEIFEFNKHIEKDENVVKMNIKYLMNRELGIDNLDIITNELSENEFDIDIKFKMKEELAKYIKKIYLEKKWIVISHYSFLVTKNFKSFQGIKKIKINRNGINLCYNEKNEIVCVYLFFLFIDVTYDVIELFKKTNIKIDIKKELKNEKINNEECCICKDEIKEGIKLKCFHIFHKTCIIEWFNINQTCPLCRTDFIDKVIKLKKIKEIFDIKSFQNYIFEYKY